MSAPIRCDKGQELELGIRVPFFVLCTSCQPLWPLESTLRESTSFKYPLPDRTRRPETPHNEWMRVSLNLSRENEERVDALDRSSALGAGNPASGCEKPSIETGCLYVAPARSVFLNLSQHVGEKEGLTSHMPQKETELIRLSGARGRQNTAPR